MSASTRFKIETIVTGVKGVEKLKNSIKQLSNTAKPTAADIATLRAAANRLGRQSDRTENELRQQVAALTDLRANVSLTGKSYKVLTADIQRATAALNQVEVASKRSGMSLKGAVKGIGAIAAGGVFGGPEGMIGGAIGLKMGGPLGAAAGAAVGAQVGMVRQAIGSTAEYSAALGRQRKALKLVIDDTKAYTAAQGFLQQKSEALAIPQDVIVRQFTALTASVKGAGHSVEDAQTVFESIASGIRGTGGSLEDMKAAMTATAQVFSKGKVSAEELRQQLGERLPGAFTIFAESMGKTPAELDKALEGGKVTLDDFMKFADVLFAKYGKNAEILAAGPEAAGDRLATAMSEMKDELGKMLRPTGAMFQTWAEDAVKNITKVIKALNRLFGIGEENKLNRLKRELSFFKGFQNFAENIDQALKDLPGNIFNRGLEGTAGFEGNKAIIKGYEERIAAIQKAREETDKTNMAQEELGKKGTFIYDSLSAGVTKYLTGIKSLSEQIGDAVGNAFKGMEDAIVSFVTTGKASFKDFARSIIADMTRIYAKQLLLKIFGSALGSTAPSNTSSIWSGQNLDKGMTYWDTSMPINNAYGNVYGSNGIVPFAKGGVVNKPTLFPFAKGGVGLMAEAGSPEAIMPLKRTQDGRLGVEAAMGRYSGSGSTTVNYTGPVMNFNGDDYVPRSAVNDIINAAASQGAKAGENRTLSTLKNSRSARSRLGM
jgi:lambda family phage tail tape measure protein